MYLDLSKDPSEWECPNDISVVFFCAGISSIKICEENPRLTYLVNVTNTVRLIERLMKKGLSIIFLSSNMVFDGLSPYATVNQYPKPKTEYGRQKFDAENMLLKLGSLVSIVRITKIINFQHKLINNWVNSLQRKEIIYPFEDMFLSPIHTFTLVEALSLIAKNKAGGLMHLSSNKDITYLDLAYKIAKVIGEDKNLIQPISFRDKFYNIKYNNIHTTLKINSTINQLGIKQPTILETVSQLEKEYIDAC